MLSNAGCRSMSEHGDRMLALLQTLTSSMQHVRASVTWLLGSQLRMQAHGIYLMGAVAASVCWWLRPFSSAFWPIVALSVAGILAQRALAASHGRFITSGLVCFLLMLQGHRLLHVG